VIFFLHYHLRINKAFASGCFFSFWDTGELGFEWKLYGNTRPDKHLEIPSLYKTPSWSLDATTPGAGFGPTRFELKKVFENSPQSRKPPCAVSGTLFGNPSWPSVILVPEFCFYCTRRVWWMGAKSEQTDIACGAFVHSIAVSRARTVQIRRMFVSWNDVRCPSLTRIPCFCATPLATDRMDRLRSGWPATGPICSCCLMMSKGVQRKDAQTLTKKTRTHT